MLFAPTLADRAILPTAWGDSYFFNRVGQKRTVAPGRVDPELTLVSINIVVCRYLLTNAGEVRP
ncbi:hypothetical protein F3I76_00170 [Pseudomonas sp. MT4]|nr:hypothetical protein [Pseudomonas sp. MT4]